MMRNFYTLLCAFLIAGSIFAQGVATSNIQPAPKKLSDFNIPRVQNVETYSLRSSVDCSSSTALYCEDFEGVTAPNLPTDLTTSSMEDGYTVPVNGNNIQVDGFYTGNNIDAGASGYWIEISEHTQFAMTNDDACLPSGANPNNNNNCDLSFEVLQLPTLDFTGEGNLGLLFEFYHDKMWSGGDAFLEISTDEGASWTDLNGGPLQATSSWQTGAYNLSEYEDEESVSIRFTWSDDNNWASGFAVDDIEIRELQEYEVVMTKKFQRFPSAILGGTTYQNTPLDQAQAIGYIFGGHLKNLGTSTLDSARVYSSITSENFNSSSDGISALSLTQDTFFCNEVFIPSATGTYTVDIFGAATEHEVESVSETIEFIVSDFDYARDVSDFTGGYTSANAINEDGVEQRGNIYQIYADATLYAIKARIHPSTTPDQEAKAILSIVDSNGNINYYSETPVINVGQHTDDWINFVFDTPEELEAGTVYLAAVHADFNDDGKFLFLANAGSSNGESLRQDISGSDGDAGDWYPLVSTPMVRLNFDSDATAPVGITENNGKEFNIYPNPNNGEFNISINNTESNNVTIAMQNIIGQNVYTETLNNITKLDKKFSFSNFEKGIYTVSVSYENGEILTQKVVIQ